MNLLEGLNAPQRAAVEHGNGPLLVFAGAGSGKTRTLTHRIAYLIQEHRVPPARILAVTFTNKAANEMRERLINLVGAGAHQIWMGTFHAMCARMLRISGEQIGLDPRFVIFDSDDSERLMRDILRAADLDKDRYPASRILHRISDAKNKMMSPEEFESVITSPNDRVVSRLYRLYQERLRAANALDFDDLLVEAVRLLRESREAHEYWSERFLHVLIDEFQDVNAAQFRWAQLLASKHRNICVVGDDDQSIYMWRGANVQIILDFEVTYPDATVIRLEQNYRSTQNILDAAHGIISRNLGRKPKQLWTTLEGGAAVCIQGTANAQEEAQWVVRQVQTLQRERRCTLSDFAILCRINAQSRPFEEAFLRARVPLKLVGTQRFYERKEIKDLVAYLKVLYNPRDDIALSRIINVPARGIGNVTVEKLQIMAQQSDRSMFEVILDENTPAALGGAAAPKIASLRRLLSTLQAEAHPQDEQGSTENVPVADLLSAVIERTDYLEYLQREKTFESVDRLANVQELLRAASDFDARIEAERADSTAFEDMAASDISHHDNVSPLGLFLESASLESGTDKGATGESVTLMTLHSAKGLEFPVVFMVGMEQGLLPHARALWGEGAGGDELEEERRLCYVGLTRAREQVYLSYAMQRTLHGRTESTQPSQFLDEIPSHLLQRCGLAASGRAGAYQAATTWEYSGSERETKASGDNQKPKATGSASRQPTFSIGDRLRHPTFGEGLVVNASPSGGMGEWVEVAFLSAGIGKKKLVVAYAPLEKV
jgi:DNA helicase-2/ATP-dependent DNA helicase PcrA